MTDRSMTRQGVAGRRSARNWLMRLFISVLRSRRRRRSGASSTREYEDKRLRKGFRPRRIATGPTPAPVPRRTPRLHLPLRAEERERGKVPRQRRGKAVATAGKHRSMADNNAGGAASLPGCNHRYLLLGPGSNL